MATFLLRYVTARHVEAHVSSVWPETEGQNCSRLLLAGPGCENLAIMLAARGSEVEYAESSPSRLDRFKRRTSATTIGRLIKATKATLDDLPFDDDTFDAVLLVRSLGTSSDPPAALLEVFRTLKPRGELIVVDIAILPKDMAHPRRVKQLEDLQNAGLLKHWLSRRQYKDMLIESGLEEAQDQDWTAEITNVLRALNLTLLIPLLILRTLGLEMVFHELYACVVLWQTLPLWSLHTFRSQKPEAARSHRAKHASSIQRHEANEPITNATTVAWLKEQRDQNASLHKFDLEETARQIIHLYGLFETRLGYRLVLDNARHFGYWEHDTKWPVPVGPPLREMERRLMKALELPKESKVLDIACGAGVVAQYMAEHGFRMNCVDLVDHHVDKTRRRIQQAGLQGRVDAVQGNYQQLPFKDGTFDGAYAIECIVHSPDPRQTFAEMFRVLRPGGRLAIHEYENTGKAHFSDSMWNLMIDFNQSGAMPSFEIFEPGVAKSMLEEVGFEDVVVADMTKNIVPMLRMFYALAVIPYQFIRIFHLEHTFPNAYGAVESWKYRHAWRYKAIRATKPAHRAIA